MLTLLFVRSFFIFRKMLFLHLFFIFPHHWCISLQSLLFLHQWYGTWDVEVTPTLFYCFCLCILLRDSHPKQSVEKYCFTTNTLEFKSTALRLINQNSKDACMMALQSHKLQVGEWSVVKLCIEFVFVLPNYIHLFLMTHRYPTYDRMKELKELDETKYVSNTLAVHIIQMKRDKTCPLTLSPLK